MPPELTVRTQADDDPLTPIGGGRWRADATMTRFQAVSPGLVERLGIPLSRWQEEAGLWYERVHPGDRDAVLRQRAQRHDHTAEYRFIAGDGRVLWLRESVRFAGDAVESTVLDVTSERRAQDLLAWQTAVLDKLASGAPLREALDAICLEAERRSEPGHAYSVLLVGADGKALRHGSAPSLPEAYNRAIDGLAIGPDVGSCGAAAHLRAPVVAEDIATDARWAAFRPLTSKLPYRACWSYPIVSAQGDLLGTWAVYRVRPGAPTPADIEIVSTATRLAAIAIDRDRSSRSTRVTEERFRLVARATNDTIWDWDLRTNDLWWNENFTSMFGYRLDEIETSIDSWTNRIHPEDLPRVKSSIHAAIEGTELTWHDEYRFRRKDGGYSLILDRGFIIRDDRGHAVRMVGSMMDLTERKAVQAELERTRHNLELILQNAGEGVYGVDAEGTTTFMNEAALKMLGLRQEEAVGRKLHDVIHHTHPNGARYHAVDCPIYQAAHGGPGASVKHEFFYHKDGTAIPVEYVTKPIHDGGRVVGAVTVFTDVRARRRAERELRESRERLDVALNAAQLGAWDLDLTTDKAVRSLRHDQIFGYATLQEEWGAERFFGHVVPEHREPVKAAFDEAFRNGRLTFECEIVRADGQRAWITAQGTVLYDGGKPVRMLGVVADITDRKRSDEALRESEARYRFLADNARDMITRSSPDGRLLYVSPAAKRILGYEPHELIGRVGMELVHPEDVERIRRERTEIVASDDARTVTLRFRRKDGSYVWLEAVAQAVHDPKTGALVELVGASRDVTERKRAEESLRQSEERLRAAITASSTGTFRWDIETSALEWDENLDRLFGLPPGKTARQLDQFTSLVHPDDRPAVLAALEKCVKEGSDFDLTFRVVWPDGSIHWLLDRGSMVRDAEGRPRYMTGACTDITARKQVEDELRYQRDLTQTIAENAGSALFMMDAKGYPIFLNDAASKLTGYASIDEIKDRPLHYAVHFRKPDGSPYPMEECPIDRANAEIKPLKNQREIFCRKDGTLFPVEYNVAPVVRGGQNLGVVLEVRDISERLATEEELRTRAEVLAKLTDKLARSNKELDQFAYITSHDLKAPLRGIANLSRWIEEDLASHITPSTREHLDLLRGRVNRMEALIDAILEYSRVGRVRTRPEPVDAGKLVDDIADLVAPPAGFSIRREGTLPVVVTEKTRLQQVMMNLITNAIKHHHDRPNGVVSVSAEDEGAFWRFRVKDNGPGIDPRFHEKIFVIFQTLEPRDKVEGTGIGLALVKKIVESYGGSVGIESAVGQGSTFHFTWPKTLPEEKDQ